jgi:hypothetical protein
MNVINENTIDLIEAPDLAITAVSGRATWDERGNSIWEWQTEPGVYSRDISAQQLRALEANDLHLMDGTQHSQDALWSRNARKFNARATQTTELVMPIRAPRPVKNGGFDNFLKLIGLPA